MKNLQIILTLILSLNLTAQNLKIETDFILLGMINDHWMTKKGDCKYHIDTFSNEDSLQFKSFLHNSHFLLRGELRSTGFNN